MRLCGQQSSVGLDTEEDEAATTNERDNLLKGEISEFVEVCTFHSQHTVSSCISLHTCSRI